MPDEKEQFNMRQDCLHITTTSIQDKITKLQTLEWFIHAETPTAWSMKKKKMQFSWHWSLHIRYLQIVC